MRRFLITAAAGMAVLSAGAMTAMATPTGPSMINSLNPVSNVALCFYVDGWNGPGLYDCGFRNRHGHGWHGKRHSDNHHDNNHNNKKKHNDNH